MSGKSYWIMIFLLHVFGFLLKEWNTHMNWIIFPQSANLSSLILFFVLILFIFFKNSPWFLFLSFHSFFLTIVSLISIEFFPSNLCCAVQSYFNCVWFLWAKPTRLLCLWDSPSKNTGVGCHILLHPSSLAFWFFFYF